MKQPGRHTKSFRNKWARAFAPLSLALVVAVGSAVLSLQLIQERQSSEQFPVRQVQSKDTSLPHHLENLLTPAAVQELASKAGGSMPTDIILESYGGEPVFKTKLNDGTTLGFHAVSGAAVPLPVDPVPTQEMKREVASESEIEKVSRQIHTTFEEAEQLAKVAFPKGDISEINLNTQKTESIITVEFVDGASVDVDGITGEVRRITTPTGAVAESSSQARLPLSKPVTPAPQEDAFTGDRQGSGENQIPAVRDVNKNNSSSDKTEASKKNVVIEGVLTMTNGLYTISENGISYKLITEDDLQPLVDETVRIRGYLVSDSEIAVVTIDARTNPSEKTAD